MANSQSALLKTEGAFKGGDAHRTVADNAARGQLTTGVLLISHEVKKKKKFCPLVASQVGAFKYQFPLNMAA